MAGYFAFVTGHRSGTGADHDLGRGDDRGQGCAGRLGDQDDRRGGTGRFGVEPELMRDIVKEKPWVIR